MASLLFHVLPALTFLSTFYRPSRTLFNIFLDRNGYDCPLRIQIELFRTNRKYVSPPGLARFKFVLWFVYVFFTAVITHIVAFKGYNTTAREAWNTDYCCY